MEAAVIVGIIAIVITGIIGGIQIYQGSSPGASQARKIFCKKLKESFDDHARRFQPYIGKPEEAYKAVLHQQGKLLPIVKNNNCQYDIWLLHPTKCGETVIRFWIGDEYTDVLTLKADGSVLESRHLDYETWKTLAQILSRSIDNNSIPYRVFSP